MFGSRSGWRTVASLLAGACVGTVLALPRPVWADSLPHVYVTKAADEKNDKKDEKKDGKEGNADARDFRPGTAAPADVPVLDLAACKILALTKQPAIAAANASYQAAVARQNALLTLRVPHFLARDLPLRRTQASIGVNIAQHDVVRTQLDTQYGVTYSYLSAQYAAEQRAMLERTREGTVKLREGVQAGLKAGKTNVRKEDEHRVEMYLHIIDSRREEAIQGEQRALAALREAIGLSPSCPLLLVTAGQYRLTAELYRDQVIAEALSRRPEIHQAALLTEVHGIEVEAQSLKRLIPISPTFASGSDIHSRPLPAGSYDENYRPAAVGPEMPVTITGRRQARAEIASAFHDRSGSVLEKAKNLIALETETAYLRYVEMSKKLAQLLEAEKKAQLVFNAVDESFQKGERATTPRDWISANTPLTEIRAQVNQTRYQLLIALAGLERATGGGYRPCFEFAPTSDAPKKEDKKDKEKDKKDNDKKDNDKPENANGGIQIILPNLEEGRR